MRGIMVVQNKDFEELDNFGELVEHSLNNYYVQSAMHTG